MATTFVIDNGAHTVKVGHPSAKPRLIPNCITKAKSERRRQFIGDQIDDCKDVSGLFYILPFQKGFLVNWDVERSVWDYIFGRDVSRIIDSTSDTCLIFTEPHFNFAAIQEGINEMFFEEYQFDSLLRVNATTLSAHHFQSDPDNEKELCCCVVDVGYSFTHVAPYCKGKKLRESVRRIDVGGKLLTNHLKDIISYRQLHVMDETYVVNQIKEDACFVSNQLFTDMQTAKLKGPANTIFRDYVLPDYTIIKRGYMKSRDQSTGKPSANEQIVRMNNERFSVPEILFHPSDIGIQQMGVAETIINSISSTPEEMQPHFYKNILLTGGSANFPGFVNRIYADVRSMAPEHYDCKVTLANNPVTHAWEGGSRLSQNSEFKKLIVTRKQYDEIGHAVCFSKFDI